MFGQSVANKLKAFDVYGKIPQDLTEPTLSGALGIQFTSLTLNCSVDHLNIDNGYFACKRNQCFSAGAGDLRNVY